MFFLILPAAIQRTCDDTRWVAAPELALLFAGCFSFRSDNNPFFSLG